MGKYIRRPPKEVLGERLSYLNSLSNAHYRRAERLGVEREFVNFADVLLACGFHCHICDTPIYRGIEADRNPHRPGSCDCVSYHFDHVVPLAEGGSHTFDNIRLAHRWCNLVKELQRRKR